MFLANTYENQTTSPAASGKWCCFDVILVFMWWCKPELFCGAIATAVAFSAREESAGQKHSPWNA